MDRENNHTANKNKQSKYGKLYFIEHSSEYLSKVPKIIQLNFRSDSFSVGLYIYEVFSSLVNSERKKNKSELKELTTTHSRNSKYLFLLLLLFAG